MQIANLNSFFFFGLQGDAKKPTFNTVDVIAVALDLIAHIVISHNQAAIKTHVLINVCFDDSLIGPDYEEPIR